MFSTLIHSAIVAVMVTLQPQAPWKDDYYHVAESMAQGAKDEPIFDGQSGFWRTVALDLSLAWFESRYDRNARGDHGKAYGLYQIHGMRGDESAYEQTIAANRLIKQSFRVCRGKPFEDKLGWYAAGGNGCERGLRESKHRMNKAAFLFRNFFQ